MKNKKNGGPAFPRPIGHVPWAEDGQGKYNNAYDGMSLRDYFAVHASHEEVKEISSVLDISIFQARYMHADAMIFEREEKGYKDNKK